MEITFMIDRYDRKYVALLWRCACKLPEYDDVLHKRGSLKIWVKGLYARIKSVRCCRDRFEMKTALSRMSLFLHRSLCRACRLPIIYVVHLSKLHSSFMSSLHLFCIRSKPGPFIDVFFVINVVPSSSSSSHLLSSSS